MLALKRLIVIAFLLAALLGAGAWGLGSSAQASGVSGRAQARVRAASAIGPAAMPGLAGLGITQTQTRTVTFAYDGANRLVSQTDDRGFQVVYEFDESGNLKTVTASYNVFMPSIER